MADFGEPTHVTRPEVAHAASLLGKKTAVIAFVSGLAASVAVFLALRHVASGDAERALGDRARQVVKALEAKVALPLQSLEAIVAFHRAEPADRARFEIFAQALLDRHPSVAALEYLEVIDDAARPAMEARLSAEAGRPVTVREPGPDGRMVPSPRRERYTVLTSLVPWNPEVVGLDIGFEPERRAALEGAAERGERLCSGRITLVEDPPEVGSVAVYEPEYERGVVPSDPIERRRAVRGYAIALFRLEPLMKQALAGLDTEGIHVRVLDKTALAGPDAAKATLFSAPTPPSGDRTVARELSFAGRTWLVEITTRLELAAGSAWVALALGVGLSLFLAVALGALAESRRFRREIRQMKRLGQYEVVRLVATGGMGRVYEARHELLKRRTALKVVPVELASEETLARFEREVRATSLLTHPNTVVVYDFGRSDHGHFYYAMEFIEGPSFEALVKLEGALPAARVRHLLLQCAGALAEAHGQGFVHRDVKPNNLMVTTRGGRFDVVKVVDFGLVRDVHAKDGRITEVGSISGTPGYLPPETFGPDGAIGPEVDVYALGCVAYQLLTGHEVFESANVSEVVAAHLGRLPIAPSVAYRADARFDAFVLRCLAKEPRERFRDAAELVAALEALPIEAWDQREAERSWRRWEATRALLEPALESGRRSAGADPLGPIDHIQVELGRGRVEDRRAFLPTRPA